MNTPYDVPKIENRPGLSAIKYRVGDYNWFLRFLLAQLAEKLPNLTTRDTDDAAIALLDAWAVVGDVLTFYQERIANEGYLNTASERLSLIQLARAIGYELKPGVSASTYLAFTLENAPDSPPSVIIPKGTQVMSVPPEGKSPQTFETREDLLARPYWNALSPRPARPQVITGQTQQLYLSGTATQLTPGDALVLVDVDHPDEANRRYFRTLTGIEILTEINQTLVRWEDPLASDVTLTLRNPQVFSFRQQAALFGNNAPRWDMMPAEAKREAGATLKGGIYRSALNPNAQPSSSDVFSQWEASSQGLPNQDVLCLVALDDCLLAGTAGSGIFRSDDTGQSWKAVNTGLSNLTIPTLYVAENQDYLYAGTLGGGVFCSKDRGDTWTPINLGSVRIEKIGGLDPAKPINTGIPNTVIRSFLAYESDSKYYVFAGTDESIYRTTNQGQDWSSEKIPEGISFSEADVNNPDYLKLGGLSNHIVYSLVSLAIEGKIEKVEATDKTITVKDVTGDLKKGQVIKVDNSTSIAIITDIVGYRLELSKELQNISSPIDFTCPPKAIKGKINSIDKTIVEISTIAVPERLEKNDKIVVNQQEVEISKIVNYTIKIDKAFDPQLVNKSFTIVSIIAGTDKGIYESSDDGMTWILKLPNKKVYALDKFTHNDITTIVAGTDDGVWLQVTPNSPWIPANHGELTDKTKVRSIAIIQKYILVATEKNLFYYLNYSDDQNWKNKNWQKFTPELSNTTSLANLKENIFAGTRFTGFAEDTTQKIGDDSAKPQGEWKNFLLENNQIDLDTLYSKILPDTWIVLSDRRENAPPPPAIVRVKNVASVQRKDFTLDSKITRIIPESSSDNLDKFSLRNTIVFIQSEPLELAKEPLTVAFQKEKIFLDPLNKNTIYLKDFVPDLKLQQTLLISGQLIRANASMGGIFCVKNWQSRSQDLSDKSIQSVAIDSGDRFFAATGNEVYRSIDRGKTWQSFSNGLNNQTITVLLNVKIPISDRIKTRGTAARGYQTKFQEILQEGDSLLVEKQNIRQSRTITKITDQERFTLDAGFVENLPGEGYNIFVERLFVGTHDGVWRFNFDNSTQVDMNDPPKWVKVLPASKISKVKTLAVMIGSEGKFTLWVGTEKGLFKLTLTSQATTSQTTWTEEKVPINGLINEKFPSITAIAIDQNTIYVSTGDRSIWYSSDLGKPWNQLSFEGIVNSLAIYQQHLFIASNTGFFQLVEGILKKDLSFQDDIGTLTVSADNQFLFAATTNGKVLRKKDSQSWEDISVGLGDRIVSAIASNETGELIAATTQGILHATEYGVSQDKLEWQHSVQGLTNTGVQGITIDTASIPYAGTQGGVFRSPDGGQTWEAMNNGLTNHNVQAIAFSEKLYAGTPEGLFVSDNGGKQWSSVNIGVARPNVQAIAVNVVKDQKPELYVGTRDRGLFQTTDGENWNLLGLGKQDIRTLYHDGTKLWIGTAGQGIFKFDQQEFKQITDTRPGKGTLSSQSTSVTLTENQTNLQVGDRILANGQTRTITAIDTDKKTLTVDKPFQPPLPANTLFEIATGLSDLYVTAIATAKGQDKDKNINYLYAGTVGSGVFRSSAQDESNLGERWEAINSGELAQNLEIRCLKIHNDKIYVGTVQGGAFRSSDQGKNWEPLRAGLTSTEISAIEFIKNRLIIGGIGIIVTSDRFNTTSVQPDDLLYVVSPPEVRDGISTWRVKNRQRFEGEIQLSQPQDISLFPAVKGDPVISERLTIAQPPDDERQPSLLLDKPLQYSYDPATAILYGNTVEATHGETIGLELLGSGNSAVTNPRFSLQKPPLTYTAAATALGGESSLEIYVNQEKWTVVDSLYPLNGNSQSYIVRVEDDGTTLVIFGDGKRGARLPTGRDNVWAIYRSGSGLDGNLEAGRLTLRKTGPANLLEVTNPLSATGGAPSEVEAQARHNAPASVRTIDRVVSLQDFEDFASTFAGIGKAQVAALQVNGRSLVHLTIAGLTGEVIDPEIALYQSLIAAIDKARDSVQPLRIDAYQPLFFKLEARILLDERFLPDKVLESVRQKLLETFSFDRRQFGQPVTSAEIINAIVSVKEVVAVDIDSFHRRDRARSLENSLPAELARWDPTTQTVQSAQLLQLRPDDILLSLVSAL